MKSAEEVAKGLAYDVALVVCQEIHQECPIAESLIPMISEAITAYAEERVREELRERMENLQDSKAYALGFREGVEKAAKVLLDLSNEKRKCADAYTEHDDRWCEVCEAMEDAYSWAEDKIRALLPPSAEKENERE